jgi:hypothetical protein
MGMFVANFVVIVGSVVQASAFQRRDMNVGRVILGIGSVLLGKSYMKTEKEGFVNAFSWHRSVCSILYGGDLPPSIQRSYDGLI